MDKKNLIIKLFKSLRGENQNSLKNKWKNKQKRLLFLSHKRTQGKPPLNLHGASMNQGYAILLVLMPCFWLKPKLLSNCITSIPFKWVLQESSKLCFIFLRIVSIVLQCFTITSLKSIYLFKWLFVFMFHFSFLIRSSIPFDFSFLYFYWKKLIRVKCNFLK